MAQTLVCVYFDQESQTEVCATPAHSKLTRMDYTELRRHPRINVDFFVDWGRSAECEHYDKITSLSINGCFLATKRELGRGDETICGCAKRRPARLASQARSDISLRVMEGAPPTGAGVEFVGLSSEMQAKLQMMMDSCQQA